GASVKIIDNDRERCHEVSDAIPGAVVIWGDGAQQEIMLEEGIGSVDGFVSLTGMDEQNILISLLAQSQNVPKVITKVNREEFMDMAAKLGLDCTVSPKHLVSDILVRYARALHNSLDSKMEKLYKLMDGKVEALEFNIGNDCPIINIPLRDMELKDNILIAGILRGRKPIIPSGNDMLLPDDKVVVLAAGLRINDLTDIMR
ncbi:MAG: NAD-binding protein, partial [Clostridia bacterium]|nr:NAD-binding protein [Clostridia bacterium]